MGYRPFLLKSLPNNILDSSKLKVLADNKRNANQKYKFGFFNNEENSVGKGKNAGYQIESTNLAYEKRNATQKNKFVFKWLATSH